jgi:hypothetical protein
MRVFLNRAALISALIVNAAALAFGPGASAAAVSTLTFLDGVSCTSRASCTAVGRSFGGATTGWTSLVEEWNGTTWTRVPTPNP